MASGAALLFSFGCQEAPKAAPKEKAPTSEPKSKAALPPPPIKLPEGKPMEPFDLPTNGGARYDASAHLGKKAILLYFFATWYSDAPREIQALSKLAKGREADLEVITVAIDAAENRAKVDEFVKAHSVSFPVLLDPSGNLLEVRYTGIAVAPQTLVIDRRGNLIATRGADADEDVPLADLVDALLARK